MSTRSALVTGGSSGIGLAIAAVLVAEGWAVTLVGRHQAKLAAASRELGVPDRVHLVAANLANDVAADVVAGHLERHGGLDMLVNNAGAGFVGPIGDKPTKVLDLELALNLRTAFRLLQESLPALRRSAPDHGSAHVVNVSSVTAIEAPPYASMYAATKAALVALSRSAHAELSPDGIHVTALIPGFVDTPGTSWVEERRHQAMILPSDVAEAVVVLRTSGRCFVPEIALTSAGAGTHELLDWRSLGR